MLSTENKYCSHALQCLIESTKHRRELESNFERSKMQEYEKTYEKQLDSCIELLKLGVECSLENDMVCISAGDDVGIVSFPQDEVKEKIGEDAFYLIFPKKEEALDDESDDEDELLDDDVEIEHKNSGWNNNVNSFNPLSMLFPFFSQLAQMQFMNQSSPPVQNTKVSDMDNPVQAVQNEIELLKGEKKKLKKIARRYKNECEQLKNQLENEPVNITDSNEVKLLNENNASLAHQVESLQAEVNNNAQLLEQSEKNVREIKDKLAEETSQKEVLEKKVSSLNETIDFIKIKHQNNITDAVRQESDKNRKEIEDLQTKLFKAEEDVKKSAYGTEVLNTQIETLTQKNEQLKKDYVVLTDNYNKRDSAYNDLNKEKSALSLKVSELLSEIDILNDKLSNSSSSTAQYEELKEKHSKLKTDYDAVTKKFNDSEAEKKQVNTQLKKITTENQLLLKKIAELEDKYKKLEESSKNTAPQIEYTSLGIRSNNDLNAQLAEKSSLKAVAYISIPDYAEFLDEYGEDVAKKTVKLTIAALIKNFGESSVYEVSDSSFAIIVDRSITAVRKALEQIAADLSNTSEFDITYYAAEIRGKNLKSAYEFSVVRVNRLNNERVTEDVDTDSDDDVTEAGNVAETENVTEEENNTYNDSYEGSDSDLDVAEVDATSIDLARQIMELQQQQLN